MALVRAGRPHPGKPSCVNPVGRKTPAIPSDPNTQTGSTGIKPQQNPLCLLVPVCSRVLIACCSCKHHLIYVATFHGEEGIILLISAALSTAGPWLWASQQWKHEIILIKGSRSGACQMQPRWGLSGNDNTACRLCARLENVWKLSPRVFNQEWTVCKYS